MVLEFKTARNINGHCNFLTIDTDKKVYARESSSWYGQDAILIKASDRKKLINQCESLHYTEVERL